MGASQELNTGLQVTGTYTVVFQVACRTTCLACNAFVAFVAPSRAYCHFEVVTGLMLHTAELFRRHLSTVDWSYLFS